MITLKPKMHADNSEAAFRVRRPALGDAMSICAREARRKKPAVAGDINPTGMSAVRADAGESQASQSSLKPSNERARTSRLTAATKQATEKMMRSDALSPGRRTRDAPAEAMRKNAMAVLGAMGIYFWPNEPSRHEPVSQLRKTSRDTSATTEKIARANRRDVPFSPPETPSAEHMTCEFPPRLIL
jgi:hypothetical protein